MGSSHTLDQLDTRFDDTHAVANAGLLLATHADTGEVLPRPPAHRAGQQRPRSGPHRE